MTIYLLIHIYDGGETVYPFLSDDAPIFFEEKHFQVLVEKFGINFEEDRGEYLEIKTMEMGDSSDVPIVGFSGAKSEDMGNE
jgi:hypothetical protein